MPILTKLPGNWQRSLIKVFFKSHFHLFVNGSLANFLWDVSYLSKISQWAEQTNRSGNFKQFGIDRKEMYQYVFELERLDEPINYLEFGVAGGDSIRWWVGKNPHPESRFVGFDTFTGLPEDWGHLSAGTFSERGQPPEVKDARCRFEKGIFQETLPKFLTGFDPKKRLLLHLDADLYSSTLFVLARMAPYLKRGDILIFDEFVALTNPTHEFRAFHDFVSAFGFKGELLAATRYFPQVAFRVL